MIIMYASDDTPLVDKSCIMDAVLLKLRKDFRSDLSQIVDVDWSDTSLKSKPNRKRS